MDRRTTPAIRRENHDFRDALSDIAHSNPRKISVDRLQEIASVALEKHAYRRGVGREPEDKQLRMF